jgi:hypothetical protein
MHNPFSGDMTDKGIRSIEEFVTAIRCDSASWPAEQPRWFRGEPDSTQALLPTLYRTGRASQENALLQQFRARASGFYDGVPDRGNTDQWLFLAQHVGLPTRLLDWTEGALIALHFALKENSPVVWMLNPLHLNHEAHGAPADVDPNDMREFPLPWHRTQPPSANGACENIGGAWEHDGRGVELPVAVYPSYVHLRLRGQRACFTIHGKRKVGLQSLVRETILKRYVVDPAHRGTLSTELKILGITESVAFPDLVGLASELRDRFPPA